MCDCPLHEEALATVPRVADQMWRDGEKNAGKRGMRRCSRGVISMSMQRAQWLLRQHDTVMMRTPATRHLSARGISQQETIRQAVILNLSHFSRLSFLCPFCGFV